MIEQTNIPIIYKNTKKIQYNLNLDFYDYYKSEFDSRGNNIYFEDSGGYWFKRQFDPNDNIIYYGNSYGNWSKYEYNSEGDLIYYEDNRGYIRDGR
jgi:hypothetical protein